MFIRICEYFSVDEVVESLRRLALICISFGYSQPSGIFQSEVTPNLAVPVICKGLLSFWSTDVRLV